MLNNKEDYVLFFLIIILVSYLMMNKENFENCGRNRKICNGKCISLSAKCCRTGEKLCNDSCIPSSNLCCASGTIYCYKSKTCISNTNGLGLALC